MTKNISEGSTDRVEKDRAIFERNARVESEIFVKMIVLDVIDNPAILGGLETDLDNKIKNYNIINRNIVSSPVHLPRNTIIATTVYGPTSTGLEDVEYVFPFFPSHISLPIKAGEHVWVLRDDPARKRFAVSYWLSRVVEPHYVDDVNHTHAPRTYDKSLIYNPEKPDDPKFEFNDGVLDDDRIQEKDTAFLGDGTSKRYESLLTGSRASSIHIYEAVPRFHKRPGDLTFEGSNNTLINLGTIRTGDSSDRNDKLPAVDDVKENSGMIDIVTGRGQITKTKGEVVSNVLGRKEINKYEQKLSVNEGDPNFPSDRARISLFQRSNFRSGSSIGLDQVLGLKSYNQSIGLDPAVGGAVVAKSDHIRFVARTDIEIVVIGNSQGENGLVDGSDTAKFASIIIKADGSIILKPAETSVLKLGDENADKAILCSPTPITTLGQVTSTPLQDTMGGFMGTGGITGVFASKVLVK